MNTRGDTEAQKSAANAVERVLRAERDAEAAIEAARQEAQVLLGAARDDALATVNRALERTARWQHTHATRLQDRLDALRRESEAAAAARPAADAAVLAAASEQVAARLTGGAEDCGHDAR